MADEVAGKGSTDSSTRPWFLELRSSKWFIASTVFAATFTVSSQPQIKALRTHKTVQDGFAYGIVTDANLPIGQIMPRILSFIDRTGHAFCLGRKIRRDA